MESEQTKIQLNSMLINNNKCHKHLEAITNRVNYISRRHKKAKNNFTPNKIQAMSLRSDPKHNIVNNDAEVPSEPTAKLLKELLPAKSNGKDSQNREEIDNRMITSPGVVKLNRYKERRQQFCSNQKLIKQQKQQQLYFKRAKRLRVIKSERTAKENVNLFWQTKFKDFETQREIKKVPQQIMQLKIDQLKLKILKQEEDSLNEFEELICHQEQLASKIKSRLNIL